MHFDQLNVQDQPKFVWPATFSLARAYLDQLARSNGMSSSRIAATRTTLLHAEQVPVAQRRAALAKLATELNNDASGVTDRAKVRMLASTVSDLSNASR